MVLFLVYNTVSNEPSFVVFFQVSSGSSRFKTGRDLTTTVGPNSVCRVPLPGLEESAILFIQSLRRSLRSIQRPPFRLYLNASDSLAIQHTHTQTHSRRSYAHDIIYSHTCITPYTFVYDIKRFYGGHYCISKQIDGNESIM